jgi:hypothetical protein
MGCAALVSSRGAAAAACKEVFRRRMHAAVLDTLFSQQQAQQQQAQQQQAQQQQAQQQAPAGSAPAERAPAPGAPQPAAAAAAAALAAGLTPAQLFAGLYGGNLLTNGAFLERQNVLKAAPPLVAAAVDAAAAAPPPQQQQQQQQAARALAWAPTFNARGMTWAHPFDFDPAV